jgi:hypothetical protein
LERLPELEAKKKPDEKDKARCSTTDPDATVMKMANGGFNPAYNVQFATDTRSQVIVGVDVVTTGSDLGQMAPMVGQIQGRYGRAPGEYEADGGFAKLEDIEAVSAPEVGCTVYAPVQKPKDPAVDRHAPRPGDSAAVAAWRRRMGTEEAKTIYKDRAATAECVMRWRVAVVWCSWWCAGWRRYGPSSSGTRWPTTCCVWPHCARRPRACKEGDGAGKMGGL